jgi:hypothetical protein
MTAMFHTAKNARWETTPGQNTHIPNIWLFTAPTFMYPSFYSSRTEKGLHTKGLLNMR